MCEENHTTVLWSQGLPLCSQCSQCASVPSTRRQLTTTYNSSAKDQCHLLTYLGPDIH